MLKCYHARWHYSVDNHIVTLDMENDSQFPIGHSDCFGIWVFLELQRYGLFLN